MRMVLPIALALLAGLAPDAAADGQILIPRGAEWRFLDTGANLPPSWTSRFFIDTAWNRGAAQLGYGDGDEETVVSFGPDPDSKYVTTYFRRSFVVSDASLFNQLTLNVLRDDGVIVYLNGFEIYRNNMPAGAVSANTLALTNVAGIAERTFFSATLSSSLLFNGDNVLAAEVHQAGADSIDLSFDLQLSASNVVTLTRGPYLQRGTPTNIVVRWRTGRPSISRVRFGASSDDLTQTSEELTPKTEHELLLEGLLPDTKYFYSVESPDGSLSGGLSNFFVTSPVRAKPTHIWVLGDPGTANYNQQAVRNSYYNYSRNRFTDLWLMLGDNAYSSGLDPEYQQAVFDMYPETLRQSVLWPTIGNHDTYSDFQMIDFPYLHIFTLPTQGEAGGIASGTKRYYSFDYGNIHFVCLDSMSSDRTAGSPMLQWLENDLEANTNDWLIAFWHHPPYSKGSHDSDYEYELVEMRENALPILENHGVDLVLSGHSHAYERSYLINGHYDISDTFDFSMVINPGDGRVDGNGAYTKNALGPLSYQGAVYCVAGTSGQTSGGELNHPAMFISVSILGSMVLDIDGNTLQAKFLRWDGLIGDHFTIVKGALPNDVQILSFNLHEYVAHLSWRSISGRYYVVQFTPNLEQPSWDDYSSAIQAADTTAEWADFVPGNVQRGFFRVVLLPQ